MSYFIEISNHSWYFNETNGFFNERTNKYFLEGWRTFFCALIFYLFYFEIFKGISNKR